MKAIKKGILYLLVLTVTLIQIPYTTIATDVYDNNSISEQKIFCQATCDDEFADNEIIVVLKSYISEVNKKLNSNFFNLPKIDKVEDLSIIDSNKVDMEDFNKNTDFHQILKLTLSVHSKENVLKTIKDLEANEIVLSAEPNFIQEIDDLEMQSVSLNTNMLVSNYSLSAPNDPYLSQQWALSNINATDAWDNWSSDVSAVKVGIMDSGIMPHPDLTGNVVQGYDGVSCTSISFLESSYLLAHGTSVAGVLGAVANNNKGISGMAQNVSMVPLNVFEVGESLSVTVSLVATLNSLIYATNNNIPIINYSVTWEPQLTYPYNYPSLYAAISNYPGLLVCAAGNDSSNGDTSPHYPSSYDLDNVLSVASINSNNQLSSFSNYGATSVDIAAPGENILTTFCPYAPTFLEEYQLSSGTSLASPYVAGVAALIKGNYPYVTTEQLKECILNGKDSITSLNGKCVTGGKLNAYKALQQASNLRAPDISITNIATTPTTIYEDDAVNFKITLRNLGDCPTPSGEYRINIYINNSLKSYKTVTLPSIASNYYIYTDDSFFWMAFSGTHTVKAVIEPLCYNGDNANNNTLSTKIIVYG